MSPIGEWRSGADEPAAAVERAFREERPAVLATLIRHVGDFQLAEDAVQDAFAAAVATWPRDGVPSNPGRVDHRRLRAVARSTACATTLARGPHRPPRRARPPRVPGARRGDRRRGAVGDDRLRLIFTCCHPALAHALARRPHPPRPRRPEHGRDRTRLLVSEPTMAQAAGARKAQDHRRPHPLPGASDEALPDRLRWSVEGGVSDLQRGLLRSEGDRLVRGELCSEAIRLGFLSSKLMPDDAEALDSWR